MAEIDGVGRSAAAAVVVRSDGGRRGARRRRLEMKMMKLPGGEGADQIWYVDTSTPPLNRPLDLDLHLYIYA